MACPETETHTPRAYIPVLYTYVAGLSTCLDHIPVDDTAPFDAVSPIGLEPRAWHGPAFMTKDMEYTKKGAVRQHGISMLYQSSGLLKIRYIART